MAKKFLVGNVRGPKGDKGDRGGQGDRGDQGIQGTIMFPITAYMPNPIAEMRVGDLSFNASANIITVGNLTLNTGDIGEITSLNPFILNPAGNIGGNMSITLSNADMDDKAGRNLFDVLKVSTMQEAMQALNARRNLPAGKKFEGLQIGDYIDGLDLSGITGQGSGTAPAAWNNTYKNNRFEIIGFNMYKGIGSTENANDYIDFAFRDCIATCRLNATSDNTGGMPNMEITPWLEGAFLTALEQRLGITLGTYNLYRSTKGGAGWRNWKIRLPSEIELFGFQTYGDELNQANTHCQFPIHQKSYHRRSKRFNGARQSYWTATPYATSTTSFVRVNLIGSVNYLNASNTLGVSPAFCIAI